MAIPLFTRFSRFRFPAVFLPDSGFVSEEVLRKEVRGVEEGTRGEIGYRRLLSFRKLKREKDTSDRADDCHEGKNKERTRVK